MSTTASLINLSSAQSNRRTAAVGTCEHCASTNVRWFTPSRQREHAAVLLCMDCQHLTIVPRPRVTAERVA